MKSIHHHHPPPLSTLNHRHAPPGGILQRHSFYLAIHPVRTKAMAIATSHLVVVGANSPSTTTGDLSVLIPTSLAFLFLYWIANFVVPAMVMKDLQSDDQNPNDEGGLK